MWYDLLSLFYLAASRQDGCSQLRRTGASVFIGGVAGRINLPLMSWVRLIYVYCTNF